MMYGLFQILQLIKCFETGLNHHVETLYEKALILFQFFYWMILYISRSHFDWSSFQVMAKNLEKSLKTNCLMRVSQLRIYLVYWMTVLDACNVLWLLTFLCIAIKVCLAVFHQYTWKCQHKHPPTSQIFLLCITQMLRVTEGKKVPKQYLH